MRCVHQKGHGIFAIDFKGNLNLQIKALVEKEGRLSDVVEIKAKVKQEREQKEVKYAV